MEIGQRALIIGKSGSGKTVLAQSILLDLIHKNPKVDVLIINHKNEKDINKLLKPEKRIPSRFRIGTRINVVPLFGNKEHEEKIDNLLHDIYQNGDKKRHNGTIVYVDEGLMIRPLNMYMLALQTQGRSKNISVITLSQRPKFISLFTVTQASEIHIFNIMGKDDIKTLERVVRPKDQTLETYIDNIPPFYYVSYYENLPNLTINKPVKFPLRGKIAPLKNMLPLKLALPIVASLAILFKVIN
jgi:DNA helicase HerA-like ATPase